MGLDREQILSIFDGIDDLIYFVDPETYDLLYGNEAFQKKWSFGPGEKCYKIVRGLNAPCVSCVNPHVLGENAGKTYVSESPDQTTGRWFRSIHQTIEWADGRHVVCKIMMDIHDRKEAEEKVRAERDKAQGYLNIVGVMIIALDPEGNVTLVNRTGCRILGYSEEEILGKNWFAHFVPESQREEIQNVFTEQLMAGNFEPAEYHENRVLTKSGEQRTILWHNALLRDLQGKIVGSLSSGEDITHLKETERALRESEKKFWSIFNNASDGIAIVKPETREIFGANETLCKMLGFTLEEIRTLKVEDIHPQRATSEILEKFGMVVRGEMTLIKDIPVKRKDLGVFYVDINSYWVTWAGADYIVGLFRDVTERRKIDEIKNSLIRNVSHELKTPIAMMEMAYNMGQEGVKTHDMSRIENAQRIMINHIKALEKDVNNILELSALEQGRALKEKKEVSLGEVSGEIFEKTKELFAAKKLTWEVNIPPDADRVWGDYKEVCMLLNNLIDNAVKFTDKGGIAVSARLLGKEVELKVCDTGCGIAAADLGKVFERFYKGKKSVAGTGLGLSICKEIAARLEGRVEIFSEGPGKGTTAVMTLAKV